MEKGVINSIKIEGVKGEGDYDLSDNKSDNKWDLSNSTAAGSYTVSFDGEEGKVEGQRALTGGKNDKKVLMMIPQPLVDGAKVTINFTPTGRGVKEASFSLGGTTWEPGRHITYVLSTTKLLNLNMGTITYPDGWESVNDNAVDKIKSSYTNGDAIGMYLVDKYNKVIEENLKFTYNDNDSKWTVESGKEFKGSPQYNYFVYYPYQEGGLPGAPAKNASNINVTSVASFFDKAIKAWCNKFDTSRGQTIDQSDIKKMNSFDLQIGKADALGESGTTINFTSMTHAMGLAEIVLGKKIVAPSPIYKTQKFGKAGVYTWGDKIVYASNNIKGYKPFNIANHKYVTIVRPKSLAGPTKLETEESDVNGWKKSLSFSPSDNQVETLEAENKQADADMSKAIEYPIDLGYIFYNDGSISKDLTGQTITSDHCPVGIIVYLAENNDGNDKWAETNTKIDEYTVGGHGLVMALMNVGSTGRNNYGNNIQWYPTSKDNQTGYQSNVLRYHLESKNREYGSGYILTSKLTDSNFKAAHEAVNYQPIYGAVKNIKLADVTIAKVTGWFLPSAGQMFAAMNATSGGITNASSLVWNTFLYTGTNTYNVSANLNQYLCNAAGAYDMTKDSNNYTLFSYTTHTFLWCSSEINSGYAVGLRLTHGGLGSVWFNYGDFTLKTVARPVRPFLAF